MDNKITLSLGGEERILDFGKVSFLRYLGEVTKDSKFDAMAAAFDNSPENVYLCTLHFVHAGLLCANHKDLSKEKVQEWVDEIPINAEVIDKIQWAGYSGMTGKPVEELKRLAEERLKKNGLAKVTA